MVESSKTLKEADKALKAQAANLSVEQRRHHFGHLTFNQMTTIVISVKDLPERNGCLSCAYACRIPKNMDYKANGSEEQLKKFKSSFKGCRG